jgi:hypothetical protein
MDPTLQTIIAGATVFVAFSGLVLTLTGRISGRIDSLADKIDERFQRVHDKLDETRDGATPKTENEKAHAALHDEVKRLGCRVWNLDKWAAKINGRLGAECDYNRITAADDRVAPGS